MIRRVSILILGLVSAAFLLAPGALARADDPPPSARVVGVVGYPQQRNLSCESRSATDLAAYWGIEFTEEAFFRRLPKSDNPQRGFVGDVDMPAGSMPPAGYGVYAEPVAATLRSFGLDAEARDRMDVEDLKQELAAQRPVVVWATYDMRLSDTEVWVSSDGETSTVVQWQHTFVVVGYDETGLLMVDAYDGSTKKVSYEAFAAAWDQLDRMAVTAAGVLHQPSVHAWLVTDSDGRCRFVVDGRWRVGPE